MVKTKTTSSQSDTRQRYPLSLPFFNIFLEILATEVGQENNKSKGSNSPVLQLLYDFLQKHQSVQNSRYSRVINIISPGLVLGMSVDTLPVLLLLLVALVAENMPTSATISAILFGIPIFI